MDVNRIMQSGSFRRRIGRSLEQIFPWILFLAFLLWGWRVKDLFHNIPYYGDVLEVLWGINWYTDVLFNGMGAGFYPGIFHPVGWQVATFAHSPAMFLILVPLSKIGGAAFAYNIAILSSFGIAFAGMYLLARRTNLSPVYASLVAVLFTFCGFRWFRIGGHLNQLLGSALLPWLLWCMGRAWGNKRFALRWFVVAGILWGIAAAISFYFLWLGGITILGWSIGKWLANRGSWRTILQGLLVTALIAAVLSAPLLFGYARAMRMADVPAADIAWTSLWGASLNSLPTPSSGHPFAWLKNLNRQLYRGPLDESGSVNLGVLASVLALVGLWQARKDRNWWPVFVVTALGLVLALGYILRWNGENIEWSGLRSIDKAIWSLGHRLKPDFFRPVEPYGPFVQGVPLPNLLFAAVVPFWEGARTLSRFAFVALPGFFLLVARGLQAGRWRPLLLTLAFLLLVEGLPSSSGSVSASPPAHRAFDWLRTNTKQQDGLIDLYAPRPNTLELKFGGEILLAGQYHHRATAAGAGSVWPAHTWFLFDWLVQHPHAVLDPDFVPILQAYRVNFILLHMQGPHEEQILQELRLDQQFRFVECFAPPHDSSPWPHPICILEVLAQPNMPMNVRLRDGWSGQEEWGVWAEGIESDARWVATTKTDHSVRVEAFPMCVPGTSQSITLVANGIPISTHEWNNCEPWSEEVKIPAALVKVGWNDLAFHYAYATKPAFVTDGRNPDERPLSVGFTKLQVKPLGVS